MQRSERASVSRCTVLHCTCMLFGITDLTLENGCITDNIPATVFMGTVVMCRQR